MARLKLTGGLTLALAISLIVGMVPSASATETIDRRKMANWAVSWSTCSVVWDGLLKCWNPGVGKDPEVKYGAAYAIERNSDCTDFVSDALHLGGGLPMDSYWYTNSDWLGRYHRSFTWSVVDQFTSYMRWTRGADYQTWNAPNQATNDADLGDVILYNWDDGHGFDHLAVETGYGPTTWKDKAGVTHSFTGDLVSQHSHARKNSPWNLGYKLETDPTKRAYMRQQGFYVLHWKNGVNGYSS